MEPLITQLTDEGILLGRYGDERIAAHAYNIAAKRLFGEYALINQMDEHPPDWLIDKIHDKCRSRLLEAALIIHSSRVREEA